jgi:hypoxanthine phosphoribosyltransferase
MPRRPTEKPNCFVISPIGEAESDVRQRADLALRKVIAPVLRSRYAVVRADQMSRPGTITTEIIRRVANDDLVVADLTGCNPNVFYELALRHQSGRPFIQIAEFGTRLPFDVLPVNVIFYDLTDPIQLETTRKELRAQLKHIEDAGGRLQIETPVSIALGRSETPEPRSIYGWDDVLPMANTLHRRIEREYEPELVVTMSGPGGIAAMLLQTLDRRNVPVVSATTFPQGQPSPDGFESAAVAAGYARLDTDKWRVYLPPVVESALKGTRVLLFDDRVMTGASHRAAAGFLAQVGMTVRRAALVVSADARDTDWFVHVSDEPFQFPWGCENGRG